MAITVLPKGRTAFFVCDVQERLRPAVANYQAVIDTAARMVQMAGLFEIPVVITEQVPRVFQSTVTEIMEKFQVLPENLRHGPFPKTKFGMLIPEVNQIIAQADIQAVVLFGVESHICVAQTAMTLLAEGKQVHVLADGVSSMNPQEIPIALNRLRNAGAQITTSESILYSIMEDAGDAKFRTFAGIMKEEKQKITGGLAALLDNARL